MQRRVFLTGGTGFIGAKFVERLLECDDIGDVNCLIRNATDSDRYPPSSRLQFTVGDVTHPESYAVRLKQSDTLIHMAAATGNVSKAEHWRVNFEGTKQLVDASVLAELRHFVFVSSIAAGYPDNKYYHYAQAKAAAEQYVLNSPLSATVIRPTMVAGHNAPGPRGLRKLRIGRLLFLFGAGEVRIQPIALSDLVENLCEISMRQPSERIIEVGGNDILPLRRLIELISSPHSKPLMAIPIPLRPARFLLAMMEPFVGRWLPLSAGQLAVFRNDSIADASNVAPTGNSTSLEELVAQCQG